MRKGHFIKSISAFVLTLSLVVLPPAMIAQTTVKMPKNKYKVQDDVQLGQRASGQVEQQFPVLNDAQTTQYVQRVGARLVAAIPQQFREPAFDYEFQVVNASDINAFALPGGPMYVNRGMIEAARNEGEMAGVMAHEISHVALRHATAQQTKLSNPWNQVLGIGAILGGAILAGEAGAQAGQIFAAGYFLRYSREYETQADILGSQIMANAGYDPRDLAGMFQTIAGEGGGSRAPEWLSSHPDPGNRQQRILAESQRLNVSPNPIKETPEFRRIQSRLRSMPPAKSLAQLQQEAERGQNTGSGAAMAGGRYTQNVPLPSSGYRTYSVGNWLRMNVPQNWREFSGQRDATFAPEGAYGKDGFTHGMMVGVHRGQSGQLSRDTDEFVRSLLQANSYLRQQTGYQNVRFAGRQGLAIQLAGRSPIYGGTELVTIYTASLRSGETFYLIAVSPQQQAANYDRTFRTVINSVRLNDASL